MPEATMTAPRRRSPFVELAISVVALGMLVNEALRPDPGRYLIVGAALALLGAIPAHWGDQVRNRMRRDRDEDDG